MNWESELIQMAIGCFGAAVVQGLHWQRIARSGKWPRYGSSKAYWLLSTFLVLAGGIVAALIANQSASALEVLVLGVAGPQLLESTARNLKEKEHDRGPYLGALAKNLRDFMST